MPGLCWKETDKPPKRFNVGTSMKHLSGLDAAFLYLETPETPMHVGGLNLYELPTGYSGD